MKKATATPSCSALKGPAIKLCRSLAVLVLLWAIPANAEEGSAELTTAATKNKEQKGISVISLWVDMGLGLVSEEAAKDKISSLGIGFKAALEKEADAMTGDLHGVRLVTGKQFSDLIDVVNGPVSSFVFYDVIGTTKKRAYLEASFPITSKFGYVAIVSVPLDDLPAATLKKVLALQHRAE
jgi:hypothetical protein